jgi:hypothetical protein
MHETLGNKPILGCLSNKDKHPSKGDAIKYIYIDSQQKTPLCRVVPIDPTDRITKETTGTP